MPPYPPTSLGDGVVLTEIAVGTDGSVRAARAVRSAAGFDDAALGALRATSFRPARVRGELAERYVYVVSVFRQPVITRRR
jgi:TonB family protein